MLVCYIGSVDWVFGCFCLVCFCFFLMILSCGFWILVFSDVLCFLGFLFCAWFSWFVCGICAWNLVLLSLGDSVAGDFVQSVELVLIWERC